MSKDTIYRQAAIDAAKKLLDYYGTNDISKEYADHAAERFMNRVPSSQPEIIQCKDCRYYRRMIDQDDLCKYRQIQVFDDDFCSRAERRTDG